VEVATTFPNLVERVRKSDIASCNTVSNDGD